MPKFLRIFYKSPPITIPIIQNTVIFKLDTLVLDSVRIELINVNNYHLMHNKTYLKSGVVEVYLTKVNPNPDTKTKPKKSNKKVAQESAYNNDDESSSFFINISINNDFIDSPLFLDSKEVASEQKGLLIRKIRVKPNKQYLFSIGDCQRSIFITSDDLNKTISICKK